MHNHLRVLMCIIALLVFGDMVSAQVRIAAPAFGSFGGGPDVVDLANLNVQMTIPIRHRAGRGIDFDYNIEYNSSVWQPVTVGSTKSWTPDPQWGWQRLQPAGQSYITYSVVYSQNMCYNGGPVPYQEWVYSNFIYYDQFGDTHYFNNSVDYFQSPGGANCPPNGPQPPTTQPAYESSGGGFTIYVTPGSGTVSAYVVDKNGTTITPPVNPNPPTQGSVTAQDTNGNLNTSVNGAYTDTLNTQALSVTGTAPSNTILSYSAPSGTATYTVNYVGHIVRTNFGCSGIVEYNSGSTQIYLVDKVTLPDSSFYQFAYEPTTGFTGDVTGRVASITLPTGDKIKYQYSGGSNGITCADGSTATLGRSNMDGSWTYAHSESGTAWTTNVTDPQSNVTVLTFQQIFETLRQVYQGSVAPSNLLQTVTTCYNGGACPTTTPPGTVSQRNVTIQLGNGGVQCLHVYLYNSTYNLLTEQDDYDYATGTPTVVLKKTLINYTAFGNGIVDMLSSVTIKDGSGNIVSTTSYNYDETAVVANTGATPQHVAVTGSRGNLTSIHYPVAPLTAQFTYYDTGTVKTSTDINGAVTTYNYPDATSTCGNSFYTGDSRTQPISMSRSIGWNCVGGLPTSATDENSKSASINYADAQFWRPASSIDETGAQTQFIYTGQNSIESKLTFNSNNSASDTLTTVDGLGRVHIQQTRQAPGSSNFDSIETDYDSLGRPNRITVPYVGTAGQTSSSAPATTTTYDAISRPLLVTDAGAGYTSYSYPQNDVITTVGPSPTGENTKRRQLEYDALGMLTSVCEITNATGSGACGQHTSQTGFWSKYSYNVLGRLLSVTQNAQASAGSQQTRSYLYDGMGRLTSETNPESGTSTYVYDVDGGCGASPGDLGKKTDANGISTCFGHDALHRVVSTQFTNSTNCKFYRYDTNPGVGWTEGNIKGRLSNAYIGNCSTGAVTGADEGYNYSARGELINLYQTTVASGVWYNSAATYWPNGALNTLQVSTCITNCTNTTNNTPVTPLITYNADGEGRPSTVFASSGQNPVTATTYNSASLPTALTYGSADTDALTYDLNTFRMTKYQFNINGQAYVGALTWNANGSLGSQVITDPFNSADAQTCSYSNDDLARIAKVDCSAAKWQQNFTYDAFGNITKTVPTGGTGNSFQPTYSPTTNRITSLPGFTPTYDADGNVTADSLHTYSWDANGNSITLDGIGLTFDAPDRMVEQNRSGALTEIVYTPTGQKFALMNGVTLQKAFVPLPGQAVAVYTSVGLDHYRHSDWLGSSRLQSSPTRTVLSTFAYAPFGETYAWSGTPEKSFTGQNSDTTPGDFDFLYREYSNQGRWASPDPAGLAAVDPTAPQSWNRYAYVSNDPLDYIDPYGLYYGPCGVFDDFCSQVQPPPPPPSCLPPWFCPSGPTGPTDPGHSTGNPGGSGGGGGFIGSDN
jgi:RHS repeat-associated protein